MMGLMSNLFRELDLPIDDTPVTGPRPGAAPPTSGRKRFDTSPGLDGAYEQRRFRETGARNAAKYGITEERFWEMVRQQEFACAICSMTFRPTARRMAIDHNHRTGEVRGVLCSKCNLALGAFQDSPYILRAAVRYLADRGHYGPDIPEAATHTR